MSSFIPKNQLHIDQHLSQVAINYRPEGFFADAIAPVVNVNKQSDLIRIIDQGDLWRIDNTVRAPGNEANRINLSVGSEQYVCKNYALRADVTVEDMANADAGMRSLLEQDRVQTLTWKLALDWNKRVADQITTTTNVGCALNVASSWTDLDNSSPYTDLNTMIDNIQDATGFRPNRAVFGGEAWRYIVRNSEIIDKTKETALTGASMNATKERVADLFELDQVLVGDVYYNSAQEGQSKSLTRALRPDVLVYYAPSRPSREVPSFMYTFRWMVPGVPSMSVERLPYDPFRKSSGLEVGYYQDEKIVESALGGLVANVTSSQ